MTQVDPLRWHEERPALREPVLVAMLTGWIDASGAAAAAMAVLDAACHARPLVTFDGDSFVDYRARRPTMSLRDGVSVDLEWPEIVLKVGADLEGRDVLLLAGPEPDMAWHHFARLVADIAVDLGVTSTVVLGAYPFATPHTRPSRLAVTSPSAELVARSGLLRSSIDVPAGMGAVLEHSLHGRGIASMGVWAQVPHYLGALSCPAATLALVDGLEQLLGLRIDAGSTREEAAAQRRRVDLLVAGNDEHQAMVLQLEAAFDSGDEAAPGVIDAPIPTGDELAAEFERFLRDQPEGGDAG